MAQRILALELVGDFVRAVAAERAWNSFAILAAYEEQRRPEEADIVAALSRLIAKSGKPDITISAFPGELVAKRTLTLPFHDNRRLEQAVPFALEEHLPFAVDDSIVAYVPLSRDGGNSTVIAAMARKGDLRAHLELLARAELDPKTVTLSALTMASLLSRSQNGSRCAHLLVDLDFARTSLILLDPAGGTRVVRTITQGLGDRNGAVASKQVIEAIRQTLLSAAEQDANADLVVTGPAGNDQELRRELAQTLDVQVRGGEDLDYPGANGRLRPDFLKYASCLSMLQGEVPANPTPVLNLRKAEFAFRGRTGDLGPFRTSAMIASAVAAMALLHFSFGAIKDLHTLGQVRKQTRAIAAPVIGDASGDPAAALSKKMAELGRRLKLYGAAGTFGSPLDVMQMLSAATPAHLGIEVDDMSVDEGGVKLSGRADSFATIDQFKKALGSNAFFSDIQVTDAKVGAEANKVQFRLSASISSTGAPD